MSAEQGRSVRRRLSNTRRSSSSRRSRAVDRSGTARTSWLALGIAAVIAGVAALFFVVRDSSVRVVAESSSPPPIAAPDRTARLSSDAPSEAPRTAVATTLAPEVQTARTEVTELDAGGPGIIRGRITAAPGVELPKTWTLVIEPHPFLKGRERAVSRRIEFTNGEQEFKVGGLPLAGYNVRAIADGLNDVACSALLVESSSNVFVNPQFRRAGFIDGSVVDARGAPVEGMTVTITSDATHARTSVRTGANGDYVIPNVTDGDYSLSIGEPNAPLLEPDRLAFKAPSMRFPTRRLPETGSIRLFTVDPSRRSLANVEVSGYSTGGAALRTTTDGHGTSFVRYLAPGKYRLQAKIEDGRRAEQWVDVTAGQESIVELNLKR
jgi:hypothetical protein